MWGSCIDPEFLEEPKGIKLYLVSQNDRRGYDTIDSFVCSATSADAARNTHPRSSFFTDKNFENIKYWEDSKVWHLPLN